MSSKPLKGGSKQKSRHVKAKKQKKRYMRSKDPILSVFMWGVQHTINEITTLAEPSLLLEEDFKAFSKLRVENLYYNKENLPGHFKFKEYCPRVFHDLRKRFKISSTEYMHSLIRNPPESFASPGHSGAKFFVSSDNKLIIKSLSSEEVALLHQILQPYYSHVVTQEGDTLLPHYLGMYRLTINNAETYWMVMRNVFSSQIKVHLKFDLKGSTVDRAASDKEKAKTSPTFKDNDFTQREEKIYIGDEARITFFDKLERDIILLQSLNLMDYSLLVGIHDCLQPVTDSDNDTDGEMEEYMSGEDHPTTPTSLTSGDELSGSLEELSSPPRLQQDSADEKQDNPVTDLQPPPQPTTRTITISPVVQEIEGATASVPRPLVVVGENAVAEALTKGFFPVVNQENDIFAITGVSEARPQIYFMSLIDVLTNYGSRKRAAHAAKTMKHGHGAEISTVKPEQYSRRFLDFLQKSII